MLENWISHARTEFFFSHPRPPSTPTSPPYPTEQNLSTLLCSALGPRNIAKCIKNFPTPCSSSHLPPPPFKPFACMFLCALLCVCVCVCVAVQVQKAMKQPEGTKGCLCMCVCACVCVDENLLMEKRVVEKLSREQFETKQHQSSWDSLLNSA